MQNSKNAELVPTYKRLPFLAVGGEGCYLVDDQGKKYLDFLGGLGVNALGHAHPEMMAALRDPSENLLHVSNLIYHRFQAPLADKLAKLSGLDRAFFANTGSRSRRRRPQAGPRLRPPSNSRGAERRFWPWKTPSTAARMGALAATWPEKYRKPFEPLPAGVRFIRQNDITHLKSNFSPRAAALLVEVIQGEGGVVELDEEFLKAGQELCRNPRRTVHLRRNPMRAGPHGKLFCLPAVRSGAGHRSGLETSGRRAAAGRHYGARKVAQAFHPGMHGSTFGGGPLQCRLALKFLEILQRPEFLKHVRQVGSYFRNRIVETSEGTPVIARSAARD